MSRDRARAGLAPVTRRHYARRLAAVALVLGLVASAFPLSPVSAARPSGGMDVLGKLAEPEKTEGSWLVGVDEKRRLLYYLYRGVTDVRLREYDLRYRIPRLKREAVIGPYEDLQINYGSPYTMQLDPKTRRMMLLGESVIRIVDLNKFKVVGSWDLTTVLPGYNAQGITYSRADKRIYVVGSMSGHQYVTFGGLVNKPAQVTVVAALDASNPSKGTSLVWARPIYQCQSPVDTYIVRALIARSRLEDALYFACLRPDPWPGESGVVRIWIDPKADQQQAMGFDVDFFPISGSYTAVSSGTVGVAAFDYKTDRFFLQSLAHATPGVWVLDGRLSAWVGFIAAPDSENRFLGFDQRSGRYYLASNKYMLVADGRSTPIEQGQVFEGVGSNSFIVVDPKTRRLFFEATFANVGLPFLEKTDEGIAVAQDRTLLTKAARPPNFDALTADIEEGPDTITTYSGGINGFGARAVAVGGYGGLLSASGTQVNIPNSRAGDRGYTAARVPLVDLRSGASSAKAQAFVSDSNTETELYDAGVEEWPWSPASCFDGGGDPGEAAGPGPGGNSRVACKLDSDQAEAYAEFGRLAGEGVSIGSSSFSASSDRDDKSGVETSATAITRGVELTTPAGSVSIAEVRSTVHTAAFGRPKTAKAKWERVLSGIEIRDASGKVVQRVGECVSTPKEDDCERVAKAMNEVLELRMRVDLPKPDVVGTPKGAFAGVGQSQADFFHGRTVYNQGTTFGGEASSGASPALQIVVFNDTVEKSRLIFQLAAVQANSIYTVSPAPEAPKLTDPVGEVIKDTGSVSTGGGGSIGSSSLSIPGGSGSLSSDAVASPVAASTGAAAVVQAVRAFLTRPLTESLLVAAVWILFLAAGAGIYRRRALMSVVNGGGG